MIRKILVLSLIALPVSATTLTPSPLGDLQAAKSFDYCAWAHDDGADIAALPDVAAYIVKDPNTDDPDRLTSAVVIDAGKRVAQASPSKRACEKTMKTGRKLVAAIRRENAKAMRRQAKFKKSKDKVIAAIQAEITALWMEDQLARVAYVQTQTKNKTDARHWAHRLATADAVAIDARSANYMRNVLAQFDWIDIHRFTRPISQHAWILVQHSDDDVELQKLALNRMTPHLESGGVLKRNYAYLWDRVAVNSGELQRYGTQPDWASCNDGMLSLMPMENPEEVDGQRSGMQLGPVQNDLEQMSRQSCVPSSADNEKVSD